MTDPIEAAKLAILAWMESDEAMALVHLSNDSEFDDAISAGQARAAIAAYLAAQWRDMDSAPKDGSLILGYFADGETAWHFDRLVCRWISDLEMWSAKGVGGLQPTHWQPLPEPPKEQG